MEDHRHHQGYDVQDLCHLISTSRPSPNSLFPHLAASNPYRSPHGNYFNHHLIPSIQGLVSEPPPESLPVVTPVSTSPWAGDGGGGSGGTSRGKVKMESEGRGDGSEGGGGGGTGRWPRQETLTLLEIRSRLDSRFKQANHKGPLWDEVSRMMMEEHGYLRSGKKCREKFENLYKYYKKTKEGKAGRQDGKHYRFFRQLEALYGECAADTNQMVSPSLVVGDNEREPSLFRRPGMITPRKKDVVGLSYSTVDAPFEESGRSLPGSSEVTDTSSEGYEDGEDRKAGKKGKGKRNWKEKIREFVDSRVRKLMEKQEEWLQRMTKALEEKEKERVIWEEEWRRREAERFKREQEFWEKERAWMENRDAAFMDAVRRFSSGDHEIEKWKADRRDVKETAAKKTRKETESRYSFSYGDETVAEIEHTLMVHGATTTTRNVPNAHGIVPNYGSSSSPCDSHNDNEGDNSSNGVHHQDLNCLRYLIGDPGIGENLWDNYELKLSK